MKKLVSVLLLVFALGLAVYWALDRFSINPPVKILHAPDQAGLPIDRLTLPQGFEVSVFAENIQNARSMCFGKDNSVLFVGSRREGNVYALLDENRDGKADQTIVLLSGGNMPNGVAYKNGDLYVAEVNRVLVFKNIDQTLKDSPTYEVVYDEYPKDSHHGWKYIAFGPDGLLYIPVGAPCNICLSDQDIFASLTRLNLETKTVEIVHRGIRNTVGFDWHPTTGELWFTDNGRDMMGDDMPQCELNRARTDYLHFGYPHCHEGDLPDPEFGVNSDCAEFIPPVHKMGPHTAPLGMAFYTGETFPAKYKNGAFIARHGSWNRSEKIGYDVYAVTTDEAGNVRNGEVFISGWLSEDKTEVWGRPVDIIQTEDGSLLISDDYADAIYKITYIGS